MPNSTGTYEQTPPPPGPVVTVTDTGGGDRGRMVIVTMRWNPARVTVGQPVPAAGSQIDTIAGWCEWNVRRELGRDYYRLPMVSNGPSSIVRAHVINVSMGNVYSNQHQIEIPAAGSASKKPSGRAGKKTKRKTTKVRRKA